MVAETVTEASSGWNRGRSSDLSCRVWVDWRKNGQETVVSICRIV